MLRKRPGRLSRGPQPPSPLQGPRPGSTAEEPWRAWSATLTPRTPGRAWASARGSRASRSRAGWSPRGQAARRGSQQPCPGGAQGSTRPWGGRALTQGPKAGRREARSGPGGPRPAGRPAPRPAQPSLGLRVPGRPAWAAGAEGRAGEGGRVGGPAGFNVLTKPHLQVNAAAHSPLPAPGALCPPRLLLSPDGRGNANFRSPSGPPPPRLIAPLQMGLGCALHADEQGLAAAEPAGRPGTPGPGPGGGGEGRGQHPPPPPAHRWARAGTQRTSSGSALFSVHFSEMGS